MVVELNISKQKKGMSEWGRERRADTLEFTYWSNKF
jgi:hypothetical protein